jgi:acyl-CoA synthetase (NDP forming)
MVYRDLATILRNLKAIAVVGASPKRGKLGYELLKNILEMGYLGKVFPVNPKYSSIMGLQSWSKVSDIKDDVDAVVIAVPPASVPEVIEDAGESGIKLAVIITSGFREVGESKLEEQVVKLGRKYDMRIIGPNSAGISVTQLNLHASIEVVPSKGNVGVVAQSGALGGVVISRLKKYGSGISYFISLGNTADVDVWEAIDVGLHDENTQVVVSYIEWLRCGRCFIETASRLTREKPLVMIKGGKGISGSRAARSHTGGMVTSYEVFRAAARKAGVILVDDVDTLVEVGEGLRKLNYSEGKRVLIVTNSGGLGVILASWLEDAGLIVPEVEESIKRHISRVVGKWPSGLNPLDFGGDIKAKEIIDALTSNVIAGIFDLAILAYVPTSAEDWRIMCDAFAHLRGNAVVPTILYIEGEGSDKVVECASIKGIATVSTARNAAILASALHERKKYLNRFE